MRPPSLRTAAILVIASLVSLAAGPATALLLSVSPGQVILKFDDRGGDGRVELTNQSASDIVIETTLSDFSLDADNQVVMTPSGLDSFASWVAVNPVRFDLPAGRTRTVRFAVRPLAKPERGEYRAMLLFSEARDKPRSGAASFKVQLGVPIYASYGELAREAELRSVRAERGRLVFEIAAGGEAHSRLSARVAAFPGGRYPGDAKVHDAFVAGGAKAVQALGALFVGRAPTGPVFPGETRRLSIDAPGVGAHGVLYVEGKLGDAAIGRSLPY